jgi:hypothetical protein
MHSVCFPPSRGGEYPVRLSGDSAYGSAEMLGWLMHQHGIEPNVTVFDKSGAQGRHLSREDFKYDPTGDVASRLARVVPIRTS